MPVLLLALEEIYAGYDLADVVSGVSLTVEAGSITCILGSHRGLVEQNVRQTLAMAYHGDVRAQGQIVASGTAVDLKANKEVQRAYFGGAIA